MIPPPTHKALISTLRTPYMHVVNVVITTIPLTLEVISYIQSKSLVISIPGGKIISRSQLGNKQLIFY